MWVYRKAEVGSTGYCVGYYGPQGEWFQDSVHVTQSQASARVHYLNGGTRNST